MKSTFLLLLVLGSIATTANAQVVLDMPAPPAANPVALTPISTADVDAQATADQANTVQASPAPGTVAIARYSYGRRAPNYSYDMPRRRNYSYSYYGYGNYIYGYPWYGWWGGFGCFNHCH